VRLTYFHANRLLFGLYKQDTEILRRKDDGKKERGIDRHGPKPSSNTSQLSDPLIFPWSLPLQVVPLMSSEKNEDISAETNLFSKISKP
jgi:hypothetical protein